MKIEVSNGEILDKLTILNIKLDKIKDRVKLSNIRNEYEYLLGLCNKLLDNKQVYMLFVQLKNVNLTLWNIENDIREKEKLQLFDEKFIDLARQVYITNDLRAKVKKQINTITESYFVEEKSYTS